MALTVGKFKRLQFKFSCEQSESIERSRVNQVSGQIFSPVENSTGEVWLQVQITFWYISLPSLHNYDVKLPNFKFYWER